MAAACQGVDSQDLATILDPFRTIFDNLGQTAFLKLEHCDIRTVATSETPPLCVETGQMFVLATEDICPVSTEHIVSLGRAEICPLPTIQIVEASDKQFRPKSSKWFEMGPEWSPGHKNRPK